jgi:predicted GTPase
VIKLFTTADGKLHKTYLKFLQNRLAKDFSLSGIVVRFE